jgi:hypothetical protein
MAKPRVNPDDITNDEVQEINGSQATSDSTNSGTDGAATESQEDSNSGNSQQATSSKAAKAAKVTDVLIDLVTERAELFHNADYESFATIEVEEHQETWRLKSAGFKRWMSHLFWDRYQTALSSSNITDAMQVLIGIAVHDGIEQRTYVRIASENERIYLDLSDEQWRAVEIDSKGWRIINDDVIPVRFIRPRGLRPLVEPQRGGSLNDLRRYVNVSDDDAFALIKATLVAMLRPNYPFPMLCIGGEQGSGKSSLCTMVRNLIDPNKLEHRSLPRESRDLAIAASNSWLLIYDNVSSIPEWLSDDLCRVLSGSGFATRELYTDSDEQLFDFQRPVILNGIPSMIERPDLLDRSIQVTLSTIPGRRRKEEEVLKQQFEKACPGILGGLLDAVSHALRTYRKTKLSPKPRMADFARFALAAEPAHSQEEIFLQAYASNRQRAHQDALDASAIGLALIEMIKKVGEIQETETGGKQYHFEGYWHELLECLNSQVPERQQRSREWPKSPRGLSAQVRRLAPDLRHFGVRVKYIKDRLANKVDLRMQKEEEKASAEEK